MLFMADSRLELGKTHVLGRRIRSAGRVAEPGVTPVRSDVLFEGPSSSPHFDVYHLPDFAGEPGEEFGLALGVGALRQSVPVWKSQWRKRLDIVGKRLGLHHAPHLG